MWRLIFYKEDINVNYKYFLCFYSIVFCKIRENKSWNRISVEFYIWSDGDFYLSVKIKLYFFIIIIKYINDWILYSIKLKYYENWKINV